MTNGHGIKVKKRSGAVEGLNLDKIHKMVEEACEGLGVRWSQCRSLRTK